MWVFRGPGSWVGGFDGVDVDGDLGGMGVRGDGRVQ